MTRLGELGEAAAMTADEVLAWLTGLPPMDYDRRRKEEAEALGIRVDTPDRKAARLRPMEAEGSAGADGLEEVEPWPTEVAGTALLTRLAERIQSLSRRAPRAARLAAIVRRGSGGVFQ